MYRETAEQLLQFIEHSPSCFHVVRSTADAVKEDGFQELKEEDKWVIQKGGKYYVTRNYSSIIAFTVPAEKLTGYRIMVSHSDSPSFKIKENPELAVDNKYVKLNVERYGGMICSPWFDRPLSVAGRVIVKEGARFVTKFVNVDRDLLMLPNLAIHINRDVNEGYKYNAQKDMLPLYGDISSKDTFMKTIADAAGVEADHILGHDLFLYNPSREVSGAQTENSSLLPGWMTFSALLHLCRDFCGETKQTIWQYTVCWTMKRSAAVQSRVPHLPFSMIHWCASTHV